MRMKKEIKEWSHWQNTYPNAYTLNPWCSPKAFTLILWTRNLDTTQSKSTDFPLHKIL